MRLDEHPEFAQAILAAAEHFRPRGLRAALIEKDYYVTEALRAVAAVGGGALIFKGGTSLSKGWNLIQRFSEDIDLFVDPLAWSPTLGARGIDRELKRLRDSVAAVPPLRFVAEESKTIGGFGRADRFSFVQRFGGPGEVAARVLLEIGTASGREPTASVQIRSYLAEFLAATGRSLNASNESSFAMRLLHFRRTFVEKLFAIHAKVEILERERRPLGSYARHYYDLHQLADQPEVVAMLRSPEYGEIRTDYDRISTEHFVRDYRPPPGLSFAQSAALFPGPELSVALGREYEAQCRVLCYGTFPRWDAVRARFDEIRQWL